MVVIFGLYAMFQLSDFSDMNLLSSLHDVFVKRETSTQTQSISEYVFYYLKKFPAYLALVWLIIFSSRQAHEANRFFIDYEHREIYISSYESFLKKIKELKDMKIISEEKEKETEELATKLLDSMIGVLSDNPAKSLDTKKTTDELPAKELINFASEVIKLKGKQ